MKVDRKVRNYKINLADVDKRTTLLEQLITDALNQLHDNTSVK